MTERIWAVIDDALIVNTIVADDAFADVIRGEHDDVVEVTNVNPRPGVGWTVEGNGYRSPQPGPAWIWDADLGQWVDTTPPEA